MSYIFTFSSYITCVFGFFFFWIPFSPREKNKGLMIMKFKLRPSSTVELGVEHYRQKQVNIHVRLWNHWCATDFPLESQKTKLPLLFETPSPWLPPKQQNTTRTPHRKNQQTYQHHPSKSSEIRPKKQKNFHSTGSKWTRSWITASFVLQFSLPLFHQLSRTFANYRRVRQWISIEQCIIVNSSSINGLRFWTFFSWFWFR